MNFLAHLYLTKDQPEEVVVGNFMADAVKGRKALAQYPKSIQLGIEIHREIDAYMDHHELVKQGAARLYPNYGKFANIIMDIYYDHLLASNWPDYYPGPLEEFSQSCYQLIRKHEHHLPESTSFWFDVMSTEDLLSSYASEEGIDSVFKRMDRRLRGISNMGKALHELKLHKKEYQLEFEQFFEDIQLHLQKTFNL